MLGYKNLRDRSVVIFVKYRKVSTRTILLNFISHCRDSVAEGRQKREIEEVYVEEAYVRQVLRCFDLILLANQGGSPGQPKRSLRVARYNCYVQLVATKRDRIRELNLKFQSARQRGGGSWSCTRL